MNSKVPFHLLGGNSLQKVTTRRTPHYAINGSDTDIECVFGMDA